MMQKQMYTGYFEKNDIERWTTDGDGPKTVKMPVYFNGLYYTCPEYVAVVYPVAEYCPYSQ